MTLSEEGKERLEEWLAELRHEADDYVLGATLHNGFLAKSVVLDKRAALLAEALAEITELRGRLQQSAGDGQSVNAPQRGPAPGGSPLAGWKTIESAPRDGSIIDLWMGAGYRWPECHWGEVDEPEDGEPEFAWLDEGGEFVEGEDNRATHWIDVGSPTRAVALSASLSSPPRVFSEEEIERAAEAMACAYAGGDVGWGLMTEEQREEYREGVRAALVSLQGGGGD